MYRGRNGWIGVSLCSLACLWASKLGHWSTRCVGTEITLFFETWSAGSLFWKSLWKHHGWSLWVWIASRKSHDISRKRLHSILVTHTRKKRIFQLKESGQFITNLLLRSIENPSEDGVSYSWSFPPIPTFHLEASSQNESGHWFSKCRWYQMFTGWRLTVSSIDCGYSTFPWTHTMWRS